MTLQQEGAAERGSDVPVAAWDGSRFAFQASARHGTVALVAHTASAQELTAVSAAGAGPCVALLPEGCRHVELQSFAGGMPGDVFAIELDDQLLPELIAPGLAGLRAVSAAVIDGALALSAASSGAAEGVMRCLNLVGAATAGPSPFTRLRVGPLHDPRGPGRRILIGATSGGGNATIEARGASEAEPLAAHVFGAQDGESMRAFAGEDASGASPEACRERGFRMLAFAGGEGGARALAIEGFHPGDEAVVFAPRGHVVAFDGEPDRTGSRLFLSQTQEGGWSARVVTAAYRPATSTAMAALGAGGALAVYEGGATATKGGIDWAADLAAAIWRRRGAAPVPGRGWLSTVPPATELLPPLEEGQAAGLSPAVAALAPAFGLSPAAVEEIDALPLQERLALVLWFGEDAALARRALRRRVLLPLPGAAPPLQRIQALLAWSEDPELRGQLEAAASRIGGASADDRDRQRILRQAASLIDEGWIQLEALSDAEIVLRQHSGGEADDGPVPRLLARLRADREVLAAAQAVSRGVDLAQLSEWRSALAGEAAEGAQPAAVMQDLGGRLAGLSAVDIILLHRHFRAAARRIKALDSLRAAVAGLDAAADNDGLAVRMDRDGDALVGMTRLGSASEAAVRALTRVPAARNALVALTGFIDRHVEAEPADAMVRNLRRDLQSYGCLLLAQTIALECAEAMARPDAAGPDGAWRERLRSGIVEMLPAYVRAAADLLPDETALGRSFTDRLPA